MKTRVRVAYDQRFGGDLYHVDRFAAYDWITPEGDKLSGVSHGLRWREVAVMVNKEEAIVMAQKLSVDPCSTAERVIAEFGGEDA